MRYFSCLLIAALLSFTANAGEVTKSFRFSDYSITEAGDYQLVKFKACLNTGYTGEPSMPWFAVKLLLPPGEEAVSVNVSGKGLVDIPGVYRIYPQQASRPLSLGYSGEFSIDQDIYHSDISYPEKIHGHITTEYMNGHSIAMLNICPLVYNPSRGSLSYYSEITVSVSTEKTAKAENALQMIPSGAGAKERIGRFVQNPVLMEDYPLKASKSDDYSLLIIADEEYDNDFEDMQDLYFLKGIASEVATTQYIYSSISGQDNQEKIRNYIIQEYQDHGIEFVLLAGDVEYIPYRGFYCYVESGSGYEDDDIPADLYYNALDGTWNDDGDDLWGEIDEEDLLPELAIGRFSFSNYGELSAMRSKTISYQDDPVLGELRDPLLAGEHLYNDPLTYGSDYLRLLVGYHDDNGYTTIGIPPDHNIDSLYERYQYWGRTEILAEINDGKSFVHHCGHANATSVMHLSNSDITNSNFSQVDGVIHNYTFVHSHGCICGAFDESDCIMERMVAIYNFAAAVIGNSRYGWFNEGQTEGPAAHLHREMVDALYEEKMDRIGTAFVECKIQTAPWVNAPGQHEEGALRWNFYDINILGDPTLQLWTDEPIAIGAMFASPMHVGDTSLSVSVFHQGNPVEGVKCSLTKDAVIHGIAYTDSIGEAVIILDPPLDSAGTAQLTISGYNCLTKTYHIPVTPAAGPYITYYDHVMDDTAGGNGNGMPEFGESVLMTIGLENAGGSPAANVSAEMTTTSEFVTVNDGFGLYGDIPADSLSFGFVNDYAIKIDSLVPDQQEVEFTLNITGNAKETWSDQFSILLNAPVLEAGEMLTDDSSGGNGDGFLDPGETAVLTIGVLNTGHADAPEAEALLTTTSSWIEISDNTFTLGELLQGEIKYAAFEVSVDDNTPLGEAVTFDFEVTSGVYQIARSYSTSIGILVEDWESGGFTSFNWAFSADAPWSTCMTEPFEGDYCVVSGEIGDNQQSELKITLEVLAGGDLSFYRKISSEPEWDFLRFYIDYELMDEWSGELGWEKVSFPVSQGLHTFSWVYEKDNYYSNGDDCAWVDYIVFPPVDITTGLSAIDIQDDGLSMSLMPNPAAHLVNIFYRASSNGPMAIEIFDLLGHKVMEVMPSRMHQAGKHSVRADVSALEPGIYLCRLSGKEGMLSKRLIIH